MTLRVVAACSRLLSRVMRRHRVSVQLDPAGSLYGRGFPRPSGSELLPSQLHTLGPHDHHATWTVSGLLLTVVYNNGSYDSLKIARLIVCSHAVGTASKGHFMVKGRQLTTLSQV